MSHDVASEMVVIMKWKANSQRRQGWDWWIKGTNRDKTVRETGLQRLHLPPPESFPQPWGKRRLKAKMLDKTERREAERRGETNKVRGIGLSVCSLKCETRENHPHPHRDPAVGTQTNSYLPVSVCCSHSPKSSLMRHLMPGRGQTHELESEHPEKQNQQTSSGG